MLLSLPVIDQRKHHEALPPPLLLLCLSFAALAAPDTPPSLAHSLDRIVAARFKPELPGVAALVVKDGRPVLRKAYGMANLELGVPVQPDHVFRIGSTTKLFTASAVMLLVDEGKLALDAPLKRYLPMHRPTRMRSPSCNS